MKEQEIRECPFCDGIAILRRNEHAFSGQDYGERYPEGIRTQSHGFYIRCHKCGCKTCYWHLEKEAVDAWSKRHNDEELLRLREALEFYANEDNWEIKSVDAGCGCCSDIIDSEIDKDDGAIAREALKEAE